MLLKHSLSAAVEAQLFQAGKTCLVYFIQDRAVSDLLTCLHCFTGAYTAGPPRPRQDPDVIRAAGKSDADPYRHVGVAAVMDTLAEQCESNLDEPTAESKLYKIPAGVL